MIDHLPSAFEAIGLHGLRWFWIPLLAWTVLVGGVHLLTRPASRLDQRLPYWLHRALWWALPVGVLLSATGLVGAWMARSGAGAAEIIGPGGGIRIGVPLLARGMVSGGADATSTVLVVAGACTVAALLVGIYHLTRLLVGSIRLRAFRADGSVPEGLGRRTRSIARRLGVRRPVTTMVCAVVSVPMTFGWRRPVIVLPKRLLDSGRDLDLAIAHELVHVQRGDYRESWFEELVAALFAGYPVVGWVRRRLSFFREVACDREVLDRFDVARGEYARLLLRIAGTGTKPGGSALALSESSNSLKDRVRAMRVNNPRLPEFLGPRRLGAVLGGLLLVGGALFVACSELVGPEPSPSSAELVAGEESSAPAEARSSSSEPEVFVAVEDMPELKGGIAGLQQKVTYPEQAAESGIEGRAIVTFEVTKEGDVENARVLKGVSESLDEEALRVVRAAKFEPGRQQGEPVRVKMSLPITFKLTGGEGRSNGSESAGSGADGSTS